MSEPAMLADHLDQRSESILAHWRAAVERDSDIHEAARLPRGEFIDHIPALLDRLAERLRGRPADAAVEGQRHGKHRWRQGYDVTSLVNELALLRGSLTRATGEFARRNAWDLDQFQAALQAVHDVLDEATAESVRQFEDDSRAETGQALAEAKARQSAMEEAWVSARLERSRLLTILRCLPAAVWVIDTDGGVVLANDEARRGHGFGDDDGETGDRGNLGRPLLRPDNTPCARDDQPVVRALRGETVALEEYAWEDGGRLRAISVNAAPLTDVSGEVVGAVAVALDLTPRKLAEAQLRREREVSKTVTDTVAEGLCTVGLDGTVTFANPAALALLGWPVDPRAEGQGLPGRPLEGAVFDARSAGAGPIARVLRTGGTVKGEDAILRRDGSRFLAEFHASPVVSGGSVVGLVLAFHDITERKRIEASLAAAEARSRLITERSPVMIWRTDHQGRCDYANQTWCEFRGTSPERAGAADDVWAGGVHPEDLERVLADFRDAFGRREAFEASYRVRRHDGAFRWVSDHGMPLHAGGEFLGYLGSCLDITPRIELETALEEQRALAEEASRHKTRLVSALSHDARTPLNAVVLAAQLLELHVGGEPDPEVRESLRTIRHSVKNVLDLLGDLLDLSRIDAGALPAEATRFPLEPVLAECLASIEPQARVKGLEVRLDPGALAGVGLETDRAKLKQILSNLLSNALRYTERGHLRIFGERSADEIRIGVEDTGIGIAGADQARIFDEFAVLDNPTRKTGEGTGLGLAICRRLAGLLRGEIRLKSAPGEGSTFTLVLPVSVLTLNHPSDASDRQVAAARPPGGGAILIAEDHDDSRQTLAKVLRRLGFCVIEADDGRQALEAARLDPSLRAVLMDVNMPVMGGVEATLAFRADPRLRSVPIFALTGDVSPDNQQRILEAGVDGCLEKPVTWDALREALDSVPERRGS